MTNPTNDFLTEKRIVISWLAHHNPNRIDFNNHVVYIFNRAICLGCFSFLLGFIVALILCNIFFSFIIFYISFPVALITFLFCWIPSILQYLIQYLRMKSINNRKIKFATRLLYPIGSVFFIFKSPILGSLISIPAGFIIVFIRRKYYKKKIKSRIQMNFS